MIMDHNYAGKIHPINILQEHCYCGYGAGTKLVPSEHDESALINGAHEKIC